MLVSWLPSLPGAAFSHSCAIHRWSKRTTQSFHKELIWKCQFSVSKTQDLSQCTLWGGMPWPVSGKKSGKVVVYRPDGWDEISNNFRQEIVMRFKIHAERTAVNGVFWLVSKPLPDAKATKQAWDVGSLRWCPSSKLSVPKGAKPFCCLIVGSKNLSIFMLSELSLFHAGFL